MQNSEYQYTNKKTTQIHQSKSSINIIENYDKDYGINATNNSNFAVELEIQKVH